MKQQIQKAITFGMCIAGGLLFYQSPVHAQPQDRQHAYLVADLDTGKILRKKNINKECYPASLTKMMTLYLLFEALRSGKITIQTAFTVSSHAAQQMPCHLGVRAGERINVKTIIEALIVKSANDVAVVAAEGLAGSVPAFVKNMNACAKKLRMTTTHFRNPSGIPDSEQKTSAKDVALLARAILRDFPEYAHFFKMRAFTHRGRTHYTHNHILNVLQGANGMKTGFINASGYNIATSVLRYDVQRRPHRFVCVVLGGKTRLDRDQEAIQLLEEVMLERGAVYYDANSVLLPCKTGIPPIAKKEPPKFVRATVCTKNGLALLLKSYQEEQNCETKRLSETIETNDYVENIDLLLKNIRLSDTLTNTHRSTRKRA